MWRWRRLVLLMLLYLFQTAYVFDVSSSIFTIAVDTEKTPINLLGLSFCIYGYVLTKYKKRIKWLL